MAFQGIIPASKLKPSPIGLFSVADEVKLDGDRNESWVRGFSYEFDTNGTLRLLTVNDAVVSGGTLANVASTADNLFREYRPFFVETEDERSMFGLPGEDRESILLRQLEAATQKALEVELWDGRAAQGESIANGNAYLTKTGAATEVSDGAKNADHALYLLEGAIANSPLGGCGVIHMTRDVASRLGSRLVYFRDSDNPGYIKRVSTRLGTPVIVGSGYSGNGPVGDAAATASLTNRWMFATGPVSYIIGAPEMVNESRSQGADTSVNTSIMKAVRPAAVFFDPSIHYTAQVTLPSVP